MTQEHWSRRHRVGVVGIGECQQLVSDAGGRVGPGDGTSAFAHGEEA